MTPRKDRSLWKRHPNQNRPVSERFWEKVKKSEGCWEWTGFVSRYGYGQLWVGSRKSGGHRPVHRLSWELHFGPIPDGIFACHKCDNRRCVNPAHLFLGTARDNAYDMIAKGRLVVHKLLRTHCASGHEYTPENTILTGGRGWRKCRQCRVAQNREGGKRRRARRRAAKGGLSLG